MILTYLLGCLSVVIMMFLVWLIYLKLDNATVVDGAWGLGFIIMSVIFVLRAEGWTSRNMILLGLMFMWGGRIIFYIVRRIISEKGEDKRYTEFRHKWKTNIDLNFLRIFEIQAILQMIIVLPALFISFNMMAQMNWLEMIGAVIVCASVIGESMADRQLMKFKNDPSNKGKTCQQGLWYYSRHPNYFFEILVWIGFFIFAVSSPWGWISILSPVLISYLILNVSGIPLAEAQSIQSRGDEYRQYQRTTSVLIPLPKKRL